jgi:hypothetical protein
MFAPACRELLAQLAPVDGPSPRLSETLLNWPDYSITALVGGLDLARRRGAPVVYPVEADALPMALPWPVSISAIVDCAAVRSAPHPTTYASPQVTAIRSESELDQLSQVLYDAYATGEHSHRIESIFWLLEIAVRNALVFSTDGTAYVGWVDRESFWLAVGDSGPGIPNRSGVATQTRRALQTLTERFDERGQPAHGLTRLLEYSWRNVPQLRGSIASGDEMYEFSRYEQSFRTIDAAGPTIIAARF